MNIYLREMKAHRTGLIWWCVGMIGLVASGMAKYDTYQGAGVSIEELFASMPKGVMVIFGMTGFDLTKASGFYGVLFLYIALMGAIHAALLGAHLISKEERDRTSEFLYAKPVSRSSALTSKLLAGVTMLVIFNLVTLISSFYFVDFFSQGESVGAEIRILMLSLLFLQLIFFTIGTLVAGAIRKPKAAPSIAMSIMFTAFLTSYLVNMNEDLDFLKYFSPFKYFDAAVLMADGRIDPVYVALSVAIVALSVFGTYRFYSARDLGV